MKRKIGFWNEIQGDADNITRPKDETPLSAPKKSLVQVYFPKRGIRSCTNRGKSSIMRE